MHAGAHTHSHSDQTHMDTHTNAHTAHPHTYTQDTHLYTHEQPHTWVHMETHTQAHTHRRAGTCTQ